uniref:Uncharacterized protein n=1 Tax=Neisseria meningitidis alpha153 TaxID=663926 RepID=C6SDH7_NEIME|nr:hypothetical protein predicted by Glimmer/Critica [Neisseria meningitidis alpha153]
MLAVVHGNVCQRGGCGGQGCGKQCVSDCCFAALLLKSISVFYR